MTHLRNLFGKWQYPTSSGQALIHALTGQKIQSSNLLTNLRADIINEPLRLLGKPTAGKQLLQFLQESSDVHFVYYTVSKDLSTHYLKIRKTTNRGSTILDPKVYHAHLLKELVKALTLDVDGREVLLCIAWVSELQRK